MGQGGYFLIYTENFAHCFSCRGFVLSRFLAFLAGMASWVEFNPQRVVVAEFDRELEGNPYHQAKYFATNGYFRSDIYDD
jgi:hypothetical protein